jgi:hypothetical protein
MPRQYNACQIEAPIYLPLVVLIRICLETACIMALCTLHCPRRAFLQVPIHSLILLQISGKDLPLPLTRTIFTNIHDCNTAKGEAFEPTNAS